MFFNPADLKYLVEGLEVTVFSLVAAAVFFPVRLVTSLLRAATTSGSLLTHTVDHGPAGRGISKAY